MTSLTLSRSCTSIILFFEGRMVCRVRKSDRHRPQARDERVVEEEHDDDEKKNNA
jgi:hypothetical protein